MNALKTLIAAGIALFGLSPALLTSAPAAAQQSECRPEAVAQRYPGYANRIVKVGVNSTYPPFSYNDPANLTRIIGLDAEIVEFALRCAGLRHEYVNGQHSGLYPALFAGTHDVMIGNIFFRPDRAERAGFVLYMVNTQSLVVRKGNPKKIVSRETMCGNTASGSFNSSSAMLVQDIGKACVEAGRPAITWVPAADHEPAYRSLANDRIDMVMDGSVSAWQRVQSREGQGFEVAFSIQTDVRSGMIVQKGNAEMLRILTDGLNELQRTGGLAALMTKYGLQPEWLIPVEARP